MGYRMPDSASRAMLPRVATGLLVYTPDELERLIEESSFVREAVLKGRVVYEKDS